jgi:hypothetical protein
VIPFAVFLWNGQTCQIWSEIDRIPSILDATEIDFISVLLKSLQSRIQASQGSRTELLEHAKNMQNSLRISSPATLPEIHKTAPDYKVLLAENLLYS